MASEEGRKVPITLTVTGFWTEHGFWQLLPSTLVVYVLPEATREDNIKAALAYMRNVYGSVGMPSGW